LDTDHNWDAVIADLNVGDSSGLATLRGLRETRPDGLPIVVLTDYDEDALGLASVQAGAQDYLKKDEVTAQTVYRSVRYAVERAAVEQRLQDAKVRRAQKTEVIGRLAGGLAHDVNNTLTVILGLGKLVLAEARPDQRQDLSTIISAAESTSGMVQRLLAFSRRQVLSRRPINSNVLLDESALLMRDTLPENIVVTVRHDDDPGIVHGDHAQLQQALLDLAMNAGRAMSGGGDLTLTAETLLVGSDFRRDGVHVQPGQYMRITVTDTGAGMSEQTRVNCFEPFYTTQGPTASAGLGLASVYGIVKQHGGYVFAEPQRQLGACFQLYLPSEEGVAPVVRPAVAQAPVQKGAETILVVEDNPALRGLAVRVLSAAGYTVLDAECGEDALAVANAHPGSIHLLLSDVVMPRTDPLKLAEMLTGANPDMTVLFMSGYPQDGVLDKGLLKPGSNFIQKPFDRATLLAQVRQLLPL